MFLTMVFFESILTSIKRKKLKIFGSKPKPKIFEFGFFICIFIATIVFTNIIAMLYLPELTEMQRFEIIQQNFWFVGLYGVAIAFGFYHYILRIDLDK
jgi:hypothetical protein